MVLQIIHYQNHYQYHFYLLLNPQTISFIFAKLAPYDASNNPFNKSHNIITITMSTAVAANTANIIIIIIIFSGMTKHVLGYGRTSSFASSGSRGGPRGLRKPCEPALKPEEAEEEVLSHPRRCSAAPEKKFCHSRERCSVVPAVEA